MQQITEMCTLLTLQHVWLLTSKLGRMFNQILVSEGNWTDRDGRGPGVSLPALIMVDISHRWSLGGTLGSDFLIE